MIQPHLPLMPNLPIHLVVFSLVCEHVLASTLALAAPSTVTTTLSPPQSIVAAYATKKTKKKKHKKIKTVDWNDLSRGAKIAILVVIGLIAVVALVVIAWALKRWVVVNKRNLHLN